MRQQSNLKLLTTKTYKYALIQQPNWPELVLHGEQDQGHSTGEVCWKHFVSYFGFCLMSPEN